MKSILRILVCGLVAAFLAAPTVASPAPERDVIHGSSAAGDCAAPLRLAAGEGNCKEQFNACIAKCGQTTMGANLKRCRVDCRTQASNCKSS